jgi:O-antigen/teichoic acid export membrane protein
VTAGASGARPAAPESPAGRSYGSGARILSIGLALTGVVTFAFFSLASYALGDDAYQPVALLWAITFIVCSVVYRPIEQLLARTLADARGHGREGSRELRTVVLLEAAAGVLSVGLALAFRDAIQTHVFGGAGELYWVFVAAIAAYSVSYFARGWLAGSGRPELYGALVFIESSGRCLFPIVALIGLTHGTLAVALGIAAAPLLSLIVVPLALRGGIRTASAGTSDPHVEEVAAEIEAFAPDGTPGEAFPEDLHLTDPEREAPGAAMQELTFRAGLVFAISVVVVMASEQTLITAGVLTEGTGAAALVAKAGPPAAIFNAFLVARAPLQLFQAIQSTLLPHLAELRTSGDQAAAAKALRTTMLAIGAFAAAVSLGLLVLGPWAMGILFALSWPYSATTLALVGVGMGLHLAAGTLNQSALAHGRAPIAAVAWAVAAGLFLTWMLTDVVDEPVARAASGYAVCSGVLLLGLLAVERRSLRA